MVDASGVDRYAHPPLMKPSKMNRDLVFPTRVLMSMAASAMCCTGCTVEGPGAEISGWSRVRVADASQEAVHDAGRYALRQWFRIASDGPEQNAIATYPLERDETGMSGRIGGEALGRRSRIRRTATMRFQTRGDQIVAECHVRRERLDTAGVRAMSSHTRFDEAPTRTPIESEAGVTPEQAQVWTDLGRDRAMERRILDVMRARLERHTG